MVISEKTHYLCLSLLYNISIEGILSSLSYRDRETHGTKSTQNETPIRERQRGRER